MKKIFTQYLYSPKLKWSGEFEERDPDICPGLKNKIKGEKRDGGKRGEEDERGENLPPIL